MCLENSIEKIKPDSDEGCDEDYPYGFVEYGVKKCCECEPEDHDYYGDDYHQICKDGQIFRELYCPESHPFAAAPQEIKTGKAHVSGLHCCSVETERCEASMAASCKGFSLDFYSFTDHNTCQDHPSAVRKPEEVVVGEGCTEAHPYLYEDTYSPDGEERCCDTKPRENEYGIVMCLDNDIDKIKPDPVEGCDEDYPYGFLVY